MKATLNQYESVVKYLVLITHLGAETSLDFPAFTKHRLIILKYKAEVNFRFVSLYCYISEANFRF